MSDRRGAVTALGRWCEANRVTYAELAKRCGMGRSTLILVATGQALPSTKHGLALTRETRLSHAELVSSSALAAATETRGGMFSGKWSGSGKANR